MGREERVQEVMIAQREAETELMRAKARKIRVEARILEEENPIREEN